jgi:hypothetical protein
MSSVLDSVYEQPTRPYAKDELTDMRVDMREKIRLGELRADHSRCEHFYYTRAKSRKEKAIMETGNTDSGACSVCYNLGKTSKQHKRSAMELVDAYWNAFHEEPEEMTHGLLDIENCFYTWLFLE